jgi:hypothetical protein
MTTATKLLCGDWRTHVGSVGEVYAVITDPPYSPKTHDGQRSGNADGVVRTALKNAYESIDESACVECVQAISYMCLPNWWVVFGDHTSSAWWRKALEDDEHYVFAPVAWVKTNPTPRLGGDGPTCSTEWITVARRRDAPRCGSLPGHYIVKVAHDGIVGGKSLNGMRAIVRDYVPRGATIFDPFAGMATTLIAARAEGRNAIGCEISAVTRAKAQRRLDHEQTEIF